MGFDDGGLSKGELKLAPEAQRAYDAIVRPNAIVPIPRYFLDRWLPLLGTSRAWLALAFRQVAFVSKAGTYEVPIQTTLRRLGHWCGLSHVRVHQVLKDPGYLTWFVRTSEGDLAERRQPRSETPSYMVRSDIPFTPADQARLSLWLKERSPTDDQDWIHALEDATQAKELILPPDAPLPEVSLTVQQMVYAQRNEDSPLPPSLDQACTELHSRWVQPERVTLATHYFIVRWLPELSPGLGWLILYLRSRVYLDEDQHVGQVWVKGGWARLAQSLGVSRKSLSRWINSSAASPFFQRREGVHDPEDRRHVLLYVRLSEPIHADDEDEYARRLSGQDLTTPITVDGQDLTNQTSSAGQSLTRGGEVSTSSGKNLTSTGQELPTERQNLTKAGTNLNKTGTFLNTLSPLSSSPSRVYQEADRFSVIVTWQIDTLLLKASLNASAVSQLLNSSPHRYQNLIGWLLFALGKPSIKSPVMFAYRRYTGLRPPDPFLKLARADAARCYRWLDGSEQDYPNGTTGAIQELRSVEAHRKLVDLGALSTEMVEQITGQTTGKTTGRTPSREGNKTKPPSLTSPNGLVAEDLWGLARSDLQMELSKTIFNTWVRDIELIAVEANKVILGAANEYARGWLEQRLTTVVERVLSKAANVPIQVEFVVSDEVER